MCGIGGILGVPLELARPAAQRMLAALRHRGPDGSGCVEIDDPAATAPPVVLVHTRLAILDLSTAANQPMAYPDPAHASLWLTFNGEIYNYRELGALTAAQAGLVPRTQSDSETILLAYRLWGEKWVEQLRGMFAFALVDTNRRCVWLARDRLGIKPLYVFRPAQGGLLFASEVRALLAAGAELVPRRLSLAAVESFLAQGAVYGELSHVQGVEALEPATLWRCDWDGRLCHRRRYWSWPCSTLPSGTTRQKVIPQLAQQLRETVQQHLLSDVPIGIFLSGGIDSTALVTLANEIRRQPVCTITIGFDQPEWDESAAAAKVAHHLGTQHHMVRLQGSDLLRDFPQVLAATDQPSVDGFNTYYVARAARQAGLTVALSGLGGDELFGGYATFRQLPPLVRWSSWFSLLRPYRDALRRLARWLHSRALLKAVELAVRPAGLSALYLLRRELFLPLERRTLLPLPSSCDPFTGLYQPLPPPPAGLDRFNQISYLEIHGYLRHMLLRDADAYSMVHGLEIRVPFLDHPLVELVATWPGRWKWSQHQPKQLLVQAVGPRFPSWVLGSAKRGFTFPWPQWLRGPLRSLAQERLLQPHLWSNIGFSYQRIEQLWQRFGRGDPSVGGLHILALVILADVVQRQQLSLP
jgi:asparagine synthase (glutamine-hydrolysing)